MNTYKVKEGDLIGDIEGFPIEVVQKMIDEQVKQGNKADISVFQDGCDNGFLRDGFDWDDTKDGEWFWSEVIEDRNFEKFFEKYPHQTVEEGIKQSDFKTILDSIGNLLEYKNSNYGNAVLEPLSIFAGKTKAGVRLDDKLSRIKNSEVLRKNDVADVLGYLVLICKENNWTNFDEFKD